MFGLTNRIKLEDLEIKITEAYIDKFFQLKFPALKHLMISLNTKSFDRLMNLDKDNLKNMIKNSPNLKTIKFQGICISSNRVISSWKKVFEEFGRVEVKEGENAKNFISKPLMMIISLKNAK